MFYSQGGDEERCGRNVDWEATAIKGFYIRLERPLPPTPKQSGIHVAKLK